MTLAALHATLMTHYGIATPQWWRSLRDDYGALQLLIAGVETYADLGKTSRVVNGQVARVIGDLMGNHDAVVGAGAAPVYGTTTLGGKPAVTLDGAADFYDCATLTHASNDYTFVAVLDPDTTAGTQTLMGCGASEEVAAVVAAAVELHDGTASRAGMMATTRAQVLMLTLDSGAGEWRWYRDGQLLATGTYDGTWDWTAPVLGALVGGEAGFFDGALALWMVVPRVLTSGERAAVHATVMGEYGLAFSPNSVLNDGWWIFREPYVTVVAGAVTAAADQSAFTTHHLAVAGAGANIVIAAGASPLGRDVCRFPGSGTKRLKAAWAMAQPNTTIVHAVLARSGAGAANKYAVDANGLRKGAIYARTSGIPGAHAGADLPLAGGSITGWRRTRATFNGVASAIAQNNGTPTTGNAGAGPPAGLTLGNWEAGDTANAADCDIAEVVIPVNPTAETLAALDAYLAADA